MEISIEKILQFKNAFRKDYGLSLSGGETKEAVENLVNFFDLLWRWDLEDKQKTKKIEVRQNEGRIQNARSL